MTSTTLSRTPDLDVLRAAEVAAREAYATYARRRDEIMARDEADRSPDELNALTTLLVDHASAANRVEAIRQSLGLGEAPDRLPIPGHRAGGGNGSLAETSGQVFARLAEEQGASERPSGGFAVPSLLSTGLAAPIGGFRAALDSTGGGGTLSPHRMTGILRSMPDRRISVLDLIPDQDVDSLGGDTLHYLRQTAYAADAPVTPPLTEKSVTVVSVERAETKLHTVATISEKMPNQLLYSYGQLEDWINRQLSRAVRESCEALCLNGVGTTEPLGILGESIQEVPRGSSDVVTAIRKAITELDLEDVQPTAVVMNPVDWETTELATDGVGRFLLFEGSSGSAKNTWRVPVVVTRTMPAGEVLVGDFTAAQRWTGASRIQWGTVGDDFKENARRMVAETGFGFAVAYPEAFVKVTGV